MTLAAVHSGAGAVNRSGEHQERWRGESRITVADISTFRPRGSKLHTPITFVTARPPPPYELALALAVKESCCLLLPATMMSKRFFSKLMSVEEFRKAFGRGYSVVSHDESLQMPKVNLEDAIFDL